MTYPDYAIQFSLLVNILSSTVVLVRVRVLTHSADTGRVAPVQVSLANSVFVISESCEYDSGSRDSSRMAELVQAAYDEEWEKVEVRRPLEAVFSCECGPSQAVRLKLGPWTLDAVVARPIWPCCAESTPLPQAPHRQFRFCMQALLREGQDAAFRDSYAPLPYCRIAQLLAVSFARNRRFRDFLKLGTFSDARAASEMASTPSPLGVLAVDGYLKRNRSRPSGPACCFVFGYRLGLGYPRGAGPPRTPAPPCTAMATLRWTGRRTTAIAESSDCSSSHPKPT